MTKDQPESKKPTEGQLKVARENLKASSITSYAAKAIGSEIAGKLMNDYDPFEKTPDQTTYEALFKKPLQSKGRSALTSPYLLQGALDTVQASLETLPVDEVLSYIDGPDAKELANKYKGMYVSELSDEEKQVVISFYMQGLVEQKLQKEVFPQGRKERSGLLKKMFAPEEQPLEEAA